jgi:hypothetical protein
MTISTDLDGHSQPNGKMKLDRERATADETMAAEPQGTLLRQISTKSHLDGMIRCSLNGLLVLATSVMTGIMGVGLFHETSSSWRSERQV